MSLVIATDFSDAASRAATAAAHLAAKRGLKLWLVHVAPESTVRALGASFRDATERTLADQADRLNALGAQVGTSLLVGALDQAVMAFADRVDALAIVVGPPSGPTTLTGLGGSLDRLAARSQRPLLVMREPEAFIAWARSERPLKVLLGVDRTEPSAAARSWVQELRRFGEVDLEAGFVFYATEEAQRLGLPRPASFDEVPPQLSRALEREISDLVGPQPDGRTVPVHLVTGLGRKADHLVQLVEERNADLLVVGTHHRRALAKLWSVSHNVLRTSPVSVATVPVAAEPPPSEQPLPSFRKVLVATDFSPLGNRAIPFAFAAAGENAEVHVLHVGDAVFSPEMERALLQRLLALVPAGVRWQGKRALPQVILAAGEDPASRIAQAAERHSVDLVVLGSHGRTGLSEFLLGSVARGVMEKVRRPVLVVRAAE